MAKRIRPREAVLQMAPYHPPTGGRADKLRLDFNENTIGCSPKVIEFLKQRLDENRLAVYPEYAEAKRDLAAYFGVAESEMLLTNGTDEAIQVLINTYVDDEDEVIILRPSYAMYKFYAEVAGGQCRGTRLPRGDARVSARGTARGDPADDARRSDLESEQPDRHVGEDRGHRADPEARGQRRRADRRGVLRVLRHHRACGISTSIRICSSAARSRRSTAWPGCAWAACSRRRATSSVMHKASRPTA